jgi:hypothetical protein
VNKKRLYRPCREEGLVLERRRPKRRRRDRRGQRRRVQPTDNAHIESFNASLRRERLSQQRFLSLADAEQRPSARSRGPTHGRVEPNRIGDRTPAPDRTPRRPPVGRTAPAVTWRNAPGAG